MDEALLAAYRATAYRVRLPGGGWAAILIDRPLPEALRPLVGARPWGFITAWNPRSQPQPRARNRAAQRRLLAALRRLPETAVVRAGTGVGQAWREASLFVVGPEPAQLDTIARAFEQHAYVHGCGDGPASLRLL